MTIRRIFLFWFLALPVFARSVTVYKGIAKDDDGKVTYHERHEVEVDKKGAVLEGKTEYKRPSGELIGRLRSNFREKLTTPPYTFEDFRDGSSHGIELKDKKYVLWKKDKNSAREEAIFDTSDFDESALVVGCQGLHFYLVDNLATLTKKKELPIKYLIPGKLDYYSFTLFVEREDSEFLYLKVRVDSLILRIFVPSLELVYRKKDGRLMGYKGLSNIPADGGDMQNVVLDYEYTDGGNVK